MNLDKIYIDGVFKAIGLIRILLVVLTKLEKIEKLSSFLDEIESEAIEKVEEVSLAAEMGIELLEMAGCISYTKENGLIFFLCFF
ncbi:MAG: hypothetical protein ACFE95_07570 [Candidatus Hodarchaeota archaeon]